MTEEQPNRVPLKGVEAVPPISRAEPITYSHLVELEFRLMPPDTGERFALFRRMLDSGRTIDAKLWPDGQVSLMVCPGFLHAYANSPHDLARQIEFIIQQNHRDRHSVE
jgi:hypothetical protein